MKLQDFRFPTVTKVDLAFPTFAADPELLKEAHLRGFVHGNTPFEKLFSDLFFKGGKLDYRQDITPEFKESASRYLRAFMGSFEPKHEHKQSICALILSELVKPPQNHP